ncbi:MAG: hypothetical protein KDA79_05400 [Planctomycetaceae bacterium]|nr:hypothetical protein [Planctomycetaceae bacterium]
MSKVVLYCLSLRGTGHFMRMSLLARRLAAQHEVYLVDGGRPVVSQIPVPGINLVELPRIWRTEADQVEPYQTSASMADVVAARRSRLEALCREIRPDLIVVDHFPFTKWVISDDILPMIRLARHLNPRAAAVCSVRTPLAVNVSTAGVQTPEQKIIQTLNHHFQALLIHSDPRFSPLEEKYPWVAKIQIPRHYTGMICQEVPEASSVEDRTQAAPAVGHSNILVSAGGDGGVLLRRSCIEAWKLLSRDTGPPAGRMTLVLPPEPGEWEIQELEQSAASLPIHIERFSPQFTGWLQQAQLSISQAGYNTCSNLLQTRVRAILLPHPTATDQAERAFEFARHGLATAVGLAELDGPRMAAAIRHALSLPAPQHDLDLNGIERSCELISQLLCEHGMDSKRTSSLL